MEGKKKSIQLTIRMPEEIRDKLVDEAKERNTSINQFILSLLWKESKNFYYLK